MGRENPGKREGSNRASISGEDDDSLGSRKGSVMAV